MNKKETNIIVSRIEQWNSRLQGLFIEDRVSLSAKFAWSKNAVSFSEKNKLKYKPITKGKSWGKEWDSAWFCLSGNLKKEWRGKKIIADLEIVSKASDLLLTKIKKKPVISIFNLNNI